MGKQDKAVIGWLESAEGRKWSEGRHGIAARDGGAGTTGVFGEMKSDTADCDWHGRCVFGRRGERRG